MELIVINEGKLKVMLTAEDVRHFELDITTPDGDSPSSRRVLREILDEVRRRTGFDASGERVLVQLYPSKGGGCELFVTKLSKRTAAGSLAPSASEPPTVYDLRPVLFALGRMSDLLAVCRQLHRAGYALFSTAYASDDGRYYLVLQERARPDTQPGALSFIEEFGERRRGTAELAYIKEHSRCIAAGDAVATLAPLSAG